uniref:Uncharacterized protein n=1 Tax=Rhipicephalus pulchellus TaxID=72859 RepID=L7LZE8_RHIPC
MDLIEILWKQDEDLGVSRDTFDYPAASESSIKEAVKPANFNSTEVPEDEDEPPEMHEDSNPWEGFQYSIDSETGEHILGGSSPEESKCEEPRERVDSGCFLLDEEEDREAIFAELERIFQGQPLQVSTSYLCHSHSLQKNSLQHEINVYCKNADMNGLQYGNVYCADNGRVRT